MTQNPVADRYANAFFEAVQREGRFDEALAHLAHLGELLAQHEDLRQFLFNPNVEVADKLRVLDRVLASDWAEEVRAFVQVVLSFGRAEALPEIIEAFRDLVDVQQRRVRVLVRAARPLSATLKAAITRRLERLEHRQVELTEETDPALIGGAQILFDRRMLDASVKTRLAELRQRLKSVRVY